MSLYADAKRLLDLAVQIAQIPDDSATDIETRLCDERDALLAKFRKADEDQAWRRALDAREWGSASMGCPVCGIGADGKPMAYACTRNDCPTRAT